MSVEKYGYKITGIRELAGRTKDIEKTGGGYHIDLYYDEETGRVFGIDKSDNPLVSYIGTARSSLSMQDIADLVCQSMREREAQCNALKANLSKE